MSDGTITIHGVEYTLIAKRLQDFREKHPDWSIRTKMLSASDRGVLFRARILDECGRVRGEGHAQERFGGKGINATSAIENCETSAVGRALAMVGFGGHQVASAEEVTAALAEQKSIQATQRVIDHNNALREHIGSVGAIKDFLAASEYDNAYECIHELKQIDPKGWEALWLAPTKGGIWTTEERGKIRSDEMNAAMKNYHNGVAA